MKNVVLGMLAKISHIDADMKQLTARVEAQSLLISALVLAVSRQGGVLISGARPLLRPCTAVRCGFSPGPVFPVEYAVA